jgi:hypothetical protein
MLLLPYLLMDILSLFTRCCLWRWVLVSYWWTYYFCCPGWKTKTYQNCDVGKKIDRKEGNVRLWVVKVTYNNIAATSWQYVLFGGWCNTISMVSYCTCNYQKMHPYDQLSGHWEIWAYKTSLTPIVFFISPYTNPVIKWSVIYLCAKDIDFLWFFYLILELSDIVESFYYSFYYTYTTTFKYRIWNNEKHIINHHSVLSTQRGNL